MKTHPCRVTYGWSMEAKIAYYSDPPDENGCQLWRGPTVDGYGRIGTANGKTAGSHRVAWEFKNGPIPAGMCVCHRCDVRSCVNVEHLFLGTKADNNADRDAKGRRAAMPDNRGEACGAAKLTEEQVLAIRSMDGELAQIGAQFGVSNALVCMIKKRKRWAHLETRRQPCLE